MSDTPYADMLRDPKQYIVSDETRNQIADNVALIESYLATERARADKAEADARRLRECYSQSFKLTAGICKIGERMLNDVDYISRERVMELITNWRIAIDKAMKDA